MVEMWLLNAIQVSDRILDQKGKREIVRTLGEI